MKLTLSLCLFIFTSIGLFAQGNDKGKFSGEAFGDYFYNVSRDSAHSKLSNAAQSGPKDFNAFQFRRVTLNYDYNFSPVFQSRVRFEANQSSATGSSITPYIKDLSLKWKNIFEGSDLIFGIQPTPTWQVSEDIWGFRALEETIMDLRNINSSRDFGIALKGKFTEDKTVGYVVMIGNSSSIGPETDKYKRAYARIDLNPDDNFVITLYGDYKFRSKIETANNAAQQMVSLNNDAITSAVFAGFQEEDISFGLEGFLQVIRNGNSEVSGNQTIFSSKNGFGISAFGNFEIFDDLSLVARYDYYDPNSKVSYDSRNYAIIGLSFVPEKNIRIIPNVLLETYEKTKTVSIDPSVTARLTVHFVY